MSVLVFVHELGHLLAAKRNRIVVEEFGFGYPPRLVKLFERDGTIYSINAIPFGGFCRMRGEDDPSLPGSFAAASKLARGLTLVAGSTMNLVLAVVLFGMETLVVGMPDAAVPGAIVSKVSTNSPAEAAGLLVSDRIIAINDVAIVHVSDLVDQSRTRLGQPVVYTIIRREPVSGSEETFQVTMIPRLNPPQGEGPLGLEIGAARRPALVGEAVRTGLAETGRVIWWTFAIPARLIMQGRPISEFGVAGPVGIAWLTGEAVQEAQSDDSIAPLLEFVALLSVALGVTNLLPIPALDGGRLLFIAIEILRRKRVEPAREGLVHLIGFGLLLLLVGVVTVQEVGSLISGNPPLPGVR
jgi:regulator of sigma E protease